MCIDAGGRPRLIAFAGSRLPGRRLADACDGRNAGPVGEQDGQRRRALWLLVLLRSLFLRALHSYLSWGIQAKCQREFDATRS